MNILRQTLWGVGVLFSSLTAPSVASAAEELRFDLYLSALSLVRDSREIEGSYEKTLYDQRIKLVPVAPGGVVSVGSLKLRVPVGRNVLIYSVRAVRAGSDAPALDVMIYSEEDEAQTVIHFTTIEPGKKLVAFGGSQIRFPVKTGVLRADFKVRNALLTKAPMAEKCISQNLSLNFLSGNVAFNCAGPMPEAKVGAKDIWGIPASPGNKSGKYCRVGNGTGSHNHVVSSRRIGVCHHYCTLIADCGEDGVWKNIRHAW